jgi:hypothetical protein
MIYDLLGINSMERKACLGNDSVCMSLLIRPGRPRDEGKLFSRLNQQKNEEKSVLFWGGVIDRNK